MSRLGWPFPASRWPLRPISNKADEGSLERFGYGFREATSDMLLPE